MASVILFLYVTPVILLLGGMVGIAILHRLYPTKYRAALKFSGTAIWLVFMVCIVMQDEIYEVLARMGKAAVIDGADTVVVTNAAPNEIPTAP
jgi:hypothetical protein